MVNQYKYKTFIRFQKPDDRRDPRRERFCFNRAKSNLPVAEGVKKGRLKKENFKKGLPALYILSGKSQEHLARSCRKYLNKTPSKLVNDIRLEYGAKLLTTTAIPIIEISGECGFESLSYFYHRFKEHYGRSPHEFTKQGMKDSVYLMGDLSVKAEIPSSIPLDVGKQRRL